MIKVELIDSMGSDSRVVDSARVSFSKLSQNYSDEQNTRLIQYLAKNGHITPFMHPQITVREKVPIFVARQRFKHTVGFSYNEVSRRYVSDPPEFYFPTVWRKKPEGSIKQGSSEEAVENFKDWGFGSSCGEKISDAYENLISLAESIYHDMIHSDVSPEMARMILPQSMMTEYIVTGSLYAFARAYKLRINSHAQKEVQDLAILWDEVLRPLFPISWSALVDKSEN